MSFVFQRFALLNQYSVYENVEVPLLAKGIEKKERKKKVLSALMQVGIQSSHIPFETNEAHENSFC